MFITTGIPAAIERIKGQQATATDEATKARLAAQLVVQQNYLAATNAITVTPPTVTLRDSLTLYRGGREIRLLFLGRGHTGGDVVVFLPKERVVVSGDLMTNGTSYIGDGYVPDWIETLNKLKALDFDWVLPGHGAAFQGKVKIDQFQAYLRDFWTQAEKLHKAGVPAAEAAKQIDLRAHAADFPSITAAGILDHGVYQAYDIMEGKIK
jgi:glyoxylase-like metal-dependent hydrolase (beta-lactamase superfamily II)